MTLDKARRVTVDLIVPNDVADQTIQSELAAKFEGKNLIVVNTYTPADHDVAEDENVCPFCGSAQFIVEHAYSHHVVVNSSGDTYYTKGVVPFKAPLNSGKEMKKLVKCNGCANTFFGTDKLVSANFFFNVLTDADFLAVESVSNKVAEIYSSYLGGQFNIMPPVEPLIIPFQSPIGNYAQFVMEKQEGSDDWTLTLELYRNHPKEGGELFHRQPGIMDLIDTHRVEIDGKIHMIYIGTPDEITDEAEPEEAKG